MAHHVRAFTAFHQPAAKREAMNESNPYTRPAMVAAFEAGWFAWSFRAANEGRPPAGVWSHLCDQAWVRGFRCRDIFENPPTTGGQM